MASYWDIQQAVGEVKMNLVGYLNGVPMYESEQIPNGMVFLVPKVGNADMQLDPEFLHQLIEATIEQHVLNQVTRETITTLIPESDKFLSDKKE